MSRPSDYFTIGELRDEFDWMFEFNSRMAERIRGDADVHNLVDYVDKLEAENAKLRELLHDFLCAHADYFAEGNYYIGDLDLEHAMHHNQAFFRREAKKLGVEVDE